MTEESAEERYNRQLAEEVEKIQAFRKATEEEFANLDPDDPEAAKIARNKLFELVPDAAETIATLLMHAESESVRGTLAKFVFTEAMRAADKGKTADAWETLFKKLQVDVEESADA